ncbi:MAG: rhomboid family intramembrane serine protease [Thermoleophilia bacterium]
MPEPAAHEPTFCYRHPSVETAVRCADCERPICPDCMVFGPVGIRCPECAGHATNPIKAVRQAAPRPAQVRALSRRDGIVTMSLIAVNVLVFLVQLAQSGSFRATGGEVVQQGVLVGTAVDSGDWWRLVTSAFLHVNPIHLLFNLLMLYWFGRPLESFLGPWRFGAVYGLSILAGAAGALLLTNPGTATLGASGAVFGVLGAGLFLERRQGVYVFGGSALMVVVVNVIFSFTFSNISIGGHLGGLVGGLLAMIVLTRLGRVHAAYSRVTAEMVVGLLAIGVVSVIVAYLRVRGTAG